MLFHVSGLSNDHYLYQAQSAVGYPVCYLFYIYSHIRFIFADVVLGNEIITTGLSIYVLLSLYQAPFPSWLHSQLIGSCRPAAVFSIRIGRLASGF